MRDLGLEADQVLDDRLGGADGAAKEELAFEGRPVQGTVGEDVTTHAWTLGGPGVS